MSTAGTATTNTGGVPDPLAGALTGRESSLSNWAGPYVTDMLGRGQALAQTPYQAYTGPLTAGVSQAQQQAFSGIAGLAVPTEQMGAFTPTSFTSEGTAQQFMSPYLQAALEPQLAEARRQAEISRVEQAGRLTKAGAFGGGRQAVMESELNRNMLRNLADITGAGYQQAFTQAQQQFNTEQARQQAAQELVNRYGLEALGAQAGLGAQERGIQQQAIDAARAQFEEERLFPYKQIQFQQSLLQGMPLAAQAYNYQQPTGLSQLLGGSAGIMSLLENLFKTPTPTPPGGPSPLTMGQLIGNTSPAAGTINTGAFGLPTGNVDVNAPGTVANQILGTPSPAAGTVNVRLPTGNVDINAPGSVSDQIIGGSPAAGTINLGI
jgi:hypothetical protein